MNALPVILGHSIVNRIAFVGPFGVGKTTALRTVSDIPVVSTEALSAEVASLGATNKTTTTVGFDYGEWQFPGGERVSLYGVPGQQRFDSMWDSLLPQSSAIVLWLYGDRPTVLDDARFWLNALAQRKALAKIAVALTRVQDDQLAVLMPQVRSVVQKFHPLAPVITADPREIADVVQAITIAMLSPYCTLERP
jgi:uncharacterized protein